MAAAVSALEPERRAAFVLTQIGLSYGETAQVRGCPIGTIRSRIARAHHRPHRRPRRRRPTTRPIRITGALTSTRRPSTRPVSAHPHRFQPTGKYTALSQPFTRGPPVEAPAGVVVVRTRGQMRAKDHRMIRRARGELFALITGLEATTEQCPRRYGCARSGHSRIGRRADSRRRANLTVVPDPPKSEGGGWSFLPSWSWRWSS